MSKSKTIRIGTGFLGLLTLLFIYFKISGVIDWSWWLVTLPIWGPVAFMIVGFLLFCALLGIILTKDNEKD